MENKGDKPYEAQRTAFRVPGPWHKTCVEPGDSPRRTEALGKPQWAGLMGCQRGGSLMVREHEHLQSIWQSTDERTHLKKFSKVPIAISQVGKPCNSEGTG